MSGNKQIDVILVLFYFFKEKIILKQTNKYAFTNADFFNFFFYIEK